MFLAGFVFSFCTISKTATVEKYQKYPQKKAAM